MKKTIIAIYGRANEGKSETIKKVCQSILSDFPNAVPSDPALNYAGDIFVTIKIDSTKIGIESQGDPNSRIVNQEDTINQLALEECDIIICATRTEGETVKKVDQIADTYKYRTLWISSFWGPNMPYQVLNKYAANNIIDIVKGIIVGQI